MQFVQLKVISLTVILFVDGHSTYMSHYVVNFCSENHIILYSLVPNVTHYIHPCGVGLFSPLKQEWKT